ncbi:MAG: type II toxin-antitoxin system RelE/ParE family toxin, partial [Hyphomonadaceae bacterium]|nr:type II toxin-antitoxin system RelE/ParE family toxin [Hyphomonadaceae bacterium]
LIARRAARDLRLIGQYTARELGRHQRSLYLRQLEQRFEWLAANPRLGKLRNEVAEGCRSFQQGQHLVVYRQTAGKIEILAVIHVSQDIGALEL